MRRIAYGDHPSQFAEYRVPEGPGPHPHAILIHGGFWRSRYDITEIEALSLALNAAGVATWSLEYRRLGNGGGWPATFEDVVTGIAALESASQAVLVGHSAGGHLALLAAAKGLVRGVVALAPVADMERARELGLSRGVVSEFIGDLPVPESSPIEQLPVGVPVHLIHGTNDGTVPVGISDRYASAARLAGDQVELTRLPGIGHFEVVDPACGTGQFVVRAVLKMLALPQSLPNA